MQLQKLGKLEMLGGQPSKIFPAPLPSDVRDLQLWLSGERSLILQSGGKASRWNDLSGNVNDVTQGTGAKQPTTGVTTENGKNVLDFDGGDSFVVPSALHAITNSANTIFVVSQTSSNNTTQRMINGTQAGSTRYLLGFENVVGRVSFLSNNASSGSLLNNTATKTNFSLYTAFRSGTTMSLSVNGGTATTNTSANDEADIDTMAIGAQASGASNQLTGSIAEIIIYDRALSAAEIALVENYLSNEWGVTLS